MGVTAAIGGTGRAAGSQEPCLGSLGRVGTWGWGCEGGDTLLPGATMPQSPLSLPYHGCVTRPGSRSSQEPAWGHSLAGHPEGGLRRSAEIIQAWKCLLKAGACCELAASGNAPLCLQRAGDPTPPQTPKNCSRAQRCCPRGTAVGQVISRATANDAQSQREPSPRGSGDMRPLPGAGSLPRTGNSRGSPGHRASITQSAICSAERRCLNTRCP